MAFGNPQLGQSDWTQSPISGDTIVNFTAKAWTGETPGSVSLDTVANMWSDIKRRWNQGIDILGFASIESPSELDYISLNQPGVIRSQAIVHNTEPDRWKVSLAPYSFSKEIARLPMGTPVIVKGRNKKNTWLYIEGPEGVKGYVVRQRVQEVSPVGTTQGFKPSGGGVGALVVAGLVAAVILGS